MLLQRADVSGLLTVTSKRLEHVDFSYPVQSVGHVIVMKKPPKDNPTLKESVFRLLEPFDSTVWIMSILGNN